MKSAPLTRGLETIAGKLAKFSIRRAAVPLTAAAHNLGTRATSIPFARDLAQLMTQRAGLGQLLVRANDAFRVISKTAPGPGTPTGVGGHQTSDPLGFTAAPMKGQSPNEILQRVPTSATLPPSASPSGC